MCRVDYDVLDSLGRLATTLGDEAEARKLGLHGELRDPTVEEVKWIEAALRLLMRRVGQYGADLQGALPQLTMSHLGRAARGHRGGALAGRGRGGGGAGAGGRARDAGRPLRPRARRMVRGPGRRSAGRGPEALGRSRGGPAGLRPDRREVLRGPAWYAHPGARSVANRWHTHGNELWEFDENGLMKRRDASISDYKIVESERRIF